MRFRRPADAAGAGERSRFDASSLTRWISNIAHHIPGDSASSALGDVSGGGPASRSAAPAIPILDYALPLVTPKLTWRDSFMWFTGFWPGVLVGVPVGAVGLLLVLVDWS